MSSPNDGIISLYDRTADDWAVARFDKGLETKWLDRLGQLIPPAGEILDIGCGHGVPVAQDLVGRGYQVTGVDSSPRLAAMARERLPQGEWIVADMRRLDLGRRFDAVVAWHSLFHLAPDEQRSMFARYARHAKPGGALLFTSGPVAGTYEGEWMGEPLYQASLAPEEYRHLLEAEGFAVIEHSIDDADTGGATVWLAQMRPASGLDGSA